MVFILFARFKLVYHVGQFGYLGRVGNDYYAFALVCKVAEYLHNIPLGIVFLLFLISLGFTVALISISSAYCFLSVRFASFMESSIQDDTESNSTTSPIRMLRPFARDMHRNAFFKMYIQFYHLQIEITKAIIISELKIYLKNRQKFDILPIYIILVLFLLFYR